MTHVQDHCISNSSTNNVDRETTLDTVDDSGLHYLEPPYPDQYRAVDVHGLASIEWPSLSIE